MAVVLNAHVNNYLVQRIAFLDVPSFAFDNKIRSSTRNGTGSDAKRSLAEPTSTASGKRLSQPETDVNKPSRISEPDIQAEINHSDLCLWKASVKKHIAEAGESLTAMQSLWAEWYPLIKNENRPASDRQASEAWKYNRICSQ